MNSKTTALLSLLTLSLASAPALAQDALVVIIDRSSSMNGAGSPDGTTKWALARDLAQAAIEVDAPGREFELWTFSGTSWTNHVNFAAGSALTDAARRSQMITALNSLPGPASSTPLAGSVCDAVDSLTSWAAASGIFPPPSLRISLFSDGLENSTPSTHPCDGPNSASDYDASNPNRGGLTPNSWEWKVLNKAITGNPNNPNNLPGGISVIVDTHTLFNFIPSFGFAAMPMRTLRPYEATPSRQLVVSGFSPSGLEFLEGLSSATGGRYVEVDPTQPPPVFADVNGNGCVDNADYYAVIGSYGQPVNSGNIDADINRNQTVDYSDYLAVLQNFGMGHSCGGAVP